MSLPIVPDGVNPYTTYLDALDTQLYDQLPPVDSQQAFKKRVIVLCCIAGYGIFISFIYVAVLIRHYRKRQTAFWVARKVDSYMTLNLHFLLPFGGTVSCASMLVYTYFQWRVLAFRENLGTFNGWRSFVWIPIMLQGYLVACAATQAYFVVSNRPGERSKKWTFSARTVNAAFYALTSIMVVSLLLTDILFAISWAKLWRALENLRIALETYEAKWTPESGLDIPALLNLQSLFDKVAEQVACNRPYKNAVITILILLAFVVALVNAGSFGLLLVIRKQINASHQRRRASRITALPPLPLTFYANEFPGAISPNLEQGAEQSPFSVTSPISIGLSSGASPFSDVTAKDYLAAGNSSENSLGSNSRRASVISDAKRLSAGRRFSQTLKPYMPWEKETAKSDTPRSKLFAPPSPSMAVDVAGDDNVRDLQRAEKDLIICVIVVVSMGLIFAGENIWNYVVVLPNRVSWVQLETSYLFVPWVYCAIYSLGATILVLNSYLRKPPQTMKPKPAAEIGVDTFLGNGPDTDVLNDLPRFNITDDSGMRVGGNPSRPGLKLGADQQRMREEADRALERIRALKALSRDNNSEETFGIGIEFGTGNPAAKFDAEPIQLPEQIHLPQTSTTQLGAISPYHHTPPSPVRSQARQSRLVFPTRRRRKESFTIADGAGGMRECTAAERVLVVVEQVTTSEKHTS